MSIRKLFIAAKQCYLRNIVLRDIDGVRHRRRALVSYITAPYYTKNPKAHTNSVECLKIISAFSALGYNVDLVSHEYKRQLDYDRYDFVFGFGYPVINAFSNRRKAMPVVAYYTGMHSYFQNSVTLDRVRMFENKTGVWALDSARYVTNDWAAIARLSSAVFVLGNEAVAETYRRELGREVLVLPSPFHRIAAYSDVLAKRRSSGVRHTVLFTSGSGMIHKGLDLLLDALLEDPRYFTYILANAEAERGFMAAYGERLYADKRVSYRGFVAIDSQEYIDVLSRSCFVISPSCSEGGGAATLNAIGNGGCIPIVSKGSSISVGDFGVEIKELSTEAVRRALEVAADFNDNDVWMRSDLAGKYVCENHSASAFETALTGALVATQRSLGI